MRLFIAVNFNEDLKDLMCGVMRELKAQASRGSFTDRDNLHLTLAFLGEIEPGRLGEITAVMKKLRSRPAELVFKGIGRFRRDGGDIYWMGAEKSSSLVSLHEELTALLRESGFPVEAREFRPHLTLGREVALKSGLDRDRFMKSMPDMRMTADIVSLMKSERINGKLTYTEIFAEQL